MTCLLICVAVASTCFGFMIFALLQAAGNADHNSEQMNDEEVDA